MEPHESPIYPIHWHANSQILIMMILSSADALVEKDQDGSDDWMGTASMMVWAGGGRMLAGKAAAGDSLLFRAATHAPPEGRRG
jgi:hypothetical protein